MPGQTREKSAREMTISAFEDWSESAGSLQPASRNRHRVCLRVRSTARDGRAHLIDGEVRRNRKISPAAVYFIESL